MAEVNIALEAFGSVVSLLLLFCCVASRGPHEKQTNVLIAMLATNVAVLICDLLTWHLEEMAQYETLLYALNFLVYSLGYVIVALFTTYLALHISRTVPLPHWITRTICALCGVAIALVVVSLFNHMYFSFDGGVYRRGELYWLSQAYPVGIILLDIGIVLSYRKSLGAHDTLALLSYGVLPVIAMLIQINVYGITLLYLSTTLSLLIIYIMIHVEQGQRLQVQELELAESRMAIMLSQIQPHFLYNALNTVKHFCAGNPQAQEIVTDLSKYLRSNMESLTNRAPIPFLQELEHLKRYLNIETIRFPDVKVVYDLQSTAFLLPALSVQPMVENAIYHGVTQRTEGGTIHIVSCEDAIGFTVCIADDGVGFDPEAQPKNERSHIGIQNVRSRLRTMCGGTLEIKSIPGKGTLVTIRIPKEAAQ